MTSQAPPAAAPQGASGPRASFGQRFVATIIDALIVLVPIAVLVGIAIATESAALIIIVYLVAIAGAIAYTVYFEGGPTGQTIGKKVMNIRVVDFNTGGPIGYGRAFVRMLVESLLSGSICYLGYLWMLWDREKQTWHDKIATTVVVPTSAYPVQQ